jgi:hypothetical protein
MAYGDALTGTLALTERKTRLSKLAEEGELTPGEMRWFRREMRQTLQQAARMKEKLAAAIATTSPTAPPAQLKPAAQAVEPKPDRVTGPVRPAVCYSPDEIGAICVTPSLTPKAPGVP